MPPKVPFCQDENPEKAPRKNQMMGIVPCSVVLRNSNASRITSESESGFLVSRRWKVNVKVSPPVIGHEVCNHPIIPVPSVLFAFYLRPRIFGKNPFPL